MYNSTVPKLQFFDNNGNPLVGGKLFTYTQGTTNLESTFQDIDGTPNTNPIILDARGECIVYLNEDKNYKFVLKDTNDNLIYSKDNIIFTGVSLATVQSLLPTLATQTKDGLLAKEDKIKLDGLPSNFDGQMSANDILTQIKTVDGSGSGLDADLLDGQHSSYFTGLITTATNTANTANSTANTANNTANAASNTANNAISQANNAYNLADGKVNKDIGANNIGSHSIFVLSYPADYDTFVAHPELGGTWRVCGRISASQLGLSVGWMYLAQKVA